MSWTARLELDYHLSAGRTVLHHRHQGPLRVLQSLYPEGDAVCHNVLVHPPGGLVGGDTLDVTVRAGPGTHALLTTPGANRYYRSEGEAACQRTRLKLGPGARLEWLPLETLAYDGCRAENTLDMALEPGAELIAWDITALGLPHAGQPFARGSCAQCLHWPGVWREQGRIDAADRRLLDGPLGLDGLRCLATLWWACGTEPAPERRQAALDLARALADPWPAPLRAGATAPNGQTVVLRVLAPQVEPAMQLLRQVWTAWRETLWARPASAPRIWNQ